MVSVIVSAYKTEKYLDECILSIVNQNYRDLEVILVDNASPDKCGSIMRDYAKTDSRVKVISLIQNDGPGGGRNAGLKIATGEYIAFVDSDDMLLPNSIETMLTSLEKNDADFAWGSVGINGDVTKESRIASKDIVLKDSEIIKAFLMGKASPVASWGKLYKRELLEGFSYALGYIDDAPVQYQLMLKARTVSFVSEIMYYHRIVPTSITHMTDTAVARYQKVTEGAEKLLVEGSKLYPQLDKLFYSNYINALYDQYYICEKYDFYKGTENHKEDIYAWNKIMNADNRRLTIQAFNTGISRYIKYFLIKYCKRILKIVTMHRAKAQ